MSRPIAFLGYSVLALALIVGCRKKPAPTNGNSETTTTSGETTSTEGTKLSTEGTKSSTEGTKSSTSTTEKSKTSAATTSTEKTAVSTTSTTGSKTPTETTKPETATTGTAKTTPKTATESKPAVAQTPGKEKHPNDEVAVTGPVPASAMKSETPAGKLAVDPLDWPNWRGPEQDRISRETGLIDHWSPDPKAKDNHILWQSEEAAGRCTPIVMNGRLYTLCRYKPGTRYEQEQVLCLDAATGKRLWRVTHNMFLTTVPAERIGWASIVGDPTTGRIYAYGTNCLMRCLEGATGKIVWERSLAEEFGFLSIFGGRTNYPILSGDLVIVSAVDTDWGKKAVPAHRFMGLDKATGEVRWFNQGTTPKPPDTTFGTPTLKVVDSQLQFIDGTSDGAVWGFEPRTGRPLWKYLMLRRGLNCSPIVEGTTVYMCQNEENLDNFTTGMITAFTREAPGELRRQIRRSHAPQGADPVEIARQNDQQEHAMLAAAGRRPAVLPRQRQQFLCHRCGQGEDHPEGSAQGR